MKTIQHRYAQDFNRRHGVLGRVWQNRYKAKLVVDQAYLDQLLAYIHLNPVAAGIAENPAAFRWSGHRELLGKVKAPVVDVDEVLSLFGENRRAARRAYNRSIRGARAEEWLAEGPGWLPWWKVGRPRKAEEIKLREGLPFIDELGRSTGPDRPRVTVGEVFAAGESMLGFDLGRLRGREKAPEVVRAREVLAVVAVIRYRLKVKDVAKAMGMSAETASRWVSRAQRRMVIDDEFRKEVDRLDRALQGDDHRSPGI